MFRQRIEKAVSYQEFFRSRKSKNVMPHKEQYPLQLFLLVALFNILLSLFMTIPLITDEYVTMAIGLFLTGGLGWENFAATGYYGFGYSMLYGFIWNFTNDLRIIFHVILLFNTLFISLVPVIAYRIANDHFKINSKYSFIIALCVGLYPANVVMSKYAMNETMLIFLVWLISLLFCEFHRRESNARAQYLFSFLIGFSSMYSYTVHGRGLALVFASMTLFFLMMLLSIGKKGVRTISINILCFLGAYVIVGIANTIVKEYIISNFLRLGDVEVANTLSHFLTPAFFSMLLSDAYHIIIGMLGQVYYIMGATFGLAAFMFVLYLMYLKKNILFKRNKENMPDLTLCFTSFVFLASVVTLAMSTLFFLNIYVFNEAIRGEYWIYGRYNDVNSGLIIFSAFILYEKLDLKCKERRWASVITLFLTSLLLIVGILIAKNYILELDNPRLSYTMVSGIVPFSGMTLVNYPTLFNYVLLSIIIIIISAVIHYNMVKIKLLLCLGIIIVIFIYSSLFSMSKFVIPSSQLRYDNIQQFVKIGSIMNEIVETYPNVYILDALIPKQSIQFAMPNHDVQFSDIFVRFSEFEKNSLIASNEALYLDMIMNDVYNLDVPGLYYIYVYGEQLRYFLEGAGINSVAREMVTSFFTPSDLRKTRGATISECGEFVYIPPRGMQSGPTITLLPGSHDIFCLGGI